jgi:hypothetical protein
VVVQGVAARRVTAVVVRAGAAAVAVPAGGVEAAEQERRHSRGHRHGGAPSPRQRLIRERSVYHKLALAPRQVKHRPSQGEEVNQGGRPPEIFRPRSARLCLAYCILQRQGKNAWLACSLRLDTRVPLLLLLFSRCRCRLPTGVLGYGILGREWYLGAHAFAPRINA